MKDDVAAAFDATDRRAAQHLFRQTYGPLVSSVHGAAPEEVEVALSASLALIRDIAPRDAIEQMLVVQMLGLHNTAMDLMTRAALAPGMATANVDTAQATKLMASFRAHAETLQKLRGKGQQKITVEHVSVHAGGQAIVGNIEAPVSAKTLPSPVLKALPAPETCDAALNAAPKPKRRTPVRRARGA